MEKAISNLACSWGLPMPILNSTRIKSEWVSGLRELPKILWFPYNISATAEASDFKFGP